jgi:hypothetical protein
MLCMTLPGSGSASSAPGSTGVSVLPGPYPPTG